MHNNSLVNALLFLFTIRWRSSSGMSVMTTTSSLRPFVGMGVTSILPDPSKVDDDHNTISFYVGTKRGKLKKVIMKSSEGLRDDDDDIAIQDIMHMEENHNDSSQRRSKTPYPIFSMISVLLPIGS